MKEYFTNKNIAIAAVIILIIILIKINITRHESFDAKKSTKVFKYNSGNKHVIKPSEQKVQNMDNSREHVINSPETKNEVHHYYHYDKKDKKKNNNNYDDEYDDYGGYNRRNRNRRNDSWYTWYDRFYDYPWNSFWDYPMYNPYVPTLENVAIPTQIIQTPPVQNQVPNPVSNQQNEEQYMYRHHSINYTAIITMFMAVLLIGFIAFMALRK